VTAGLDPALSPILHDLLAKPWRFAMGLHALDPACWLIRTRHHAAEIGEKRRLLAAGAEVWRQLPEGEAAALEMADRLGDNLARYHPQVRLDPALEPPLVRLGCAVQEDLCLMLADPAGYRLVAAFVAFPARWNLADKIGRPIQAIHAPVPGLEAAIGRPLGLFFDRLAAGHPVWRANWSISDDPTLHQPSHGFRRTVKPIAAEEAGERLFLRVERQTLTRLPRTGAVLFTILTFVAPLAAVAAEPVLARDLGSRLGELTEPMLAYKNLARYRPAILAYLGG
jgi:hypothetical protein